MENVSHVTVSEAAWREAGEGVVCNGVWGLEGTGITHVMDLGYSDSGCLILGCFYDSERCHLLRASGYWRSKGKVPLTTYHRRVHCNRVFLSKRFWYSTSCRTTFGNSPHMRFCYTVGFATQPVLQHRCNNRFCNTTSLCLLCKIIGQRI